MPTSNIHPPTSSGMKRPGRTFEKQQQWKQPLIASVALKFQITWPKTWKTNTNIQSLKWKRFNKNKGHCHGLSMIAPLWRPANKIHLLEAPCPRSAIDPRMGWTPEFGQKESPQKALHSPTCKTRTKQKDQRNAQSENSGFCQVRFCSSSGCLLNPQNISKTKTSKHKVSSCCQQIAEMQLANLDLTFAEMMVRYIMSQIIPCFCLLPRCNFLGGRSSK